MTPFRLFAHALFAALALVAATAAAASDFTPEERETLRQIQKVFEPSCIKGMKDKFASQPARTPMLANWMAQFASPGGVCRCVSDKVMQDITPELLRGPDPAAALKRLIAHEGSVCTVSSLQASFPKLCNDLVTSLTPESIDRPDLTAIVGQTCSCMQTRIDALTPDSIQGYFAAAIQGGGTLTAQDDPTDTLPSLKRDLRQCAVPQPAAASASRPEPQ